MADPRPGSGAARRRRQQAQRATARHVGWLVGLSQAIRSHHTWEGGDTAAAVGVKPPPWRGRTAAPRPRVRAPCRLWRQLTLAEAWARARSPGEAAGQLPAGAPTVEGAEALSLGGGVSRPPTCCSSFGIEIGFIDNVDMVKTNEKEEVFAASAAPAGDGSSHSADETVGESCPQAGNRGRSHSDAAASEHEDVIKKRAMEILAAFKAGACTLPPTSHADAAASEYEDAIKKRVKEIVAALEAGARTLPPTAPEWPPWAEEMAVLEAARARGRQKLAAAKSKGTQRRS